MVGCWSCLKEELGYRAVKIMLKVKGGYLSEGSGIQTSTVWITRFIDPL